MALKRQVFKSYVSAKRSKSQSVAKEVTIARVTMGMIKKLVSMQTHSVGVMVLCTEQLTYVCTEGLHLITPCSWTGLL